MAATCEIGRGFRLTAFFLFFLKKNVLPTFKLTQFGRMQCYIKLGTGKTDVLKNRESDPKRQHATPEANHDEKNVQRTSHPARDHLGEFRFHPHLGCRNGYHLQTRLGVSSINTFPMKRHTDCPGNDGWKIGSCEDPPLPPGLSAFCQHVSQKTRMITWKRIRSDLEFLSSSTMLENGGRNDPEESTAERQK